MLVPAVMARVVALLRSDNLETVRHAVMTVASLASMPCHRCAPWHSSLRRSSPHTRQPSTSSASPGLDEGERTSRRVSVGRGATSTPMSDASQPQSQRSGAHPSPQQRPRAARRERASSAEVCEVLEGLELSFCRAHNTERPTRKSLQRLLRRFRNVQPGSDDVGVCVRCSYGLGGLDDVIRRPMPSHVFGDSSDDFSFAGVLPTPVTAASSSTSSPFPNTPVPSTGRSYSVGDGVTASPSRLSGGGVAGGRLDTSQLTSTAMFHHFHSSRFGVLPALLQLLGANTDRIRVEVLRALVSLAVKRRHRVLIANVALPSLLMFAREADLAGPAEELLRRLGFQRGIADVALCYNGDPLLMHEWFEMNRSLQAQDRIDRRMMRRAHRTWESVDMNARCRPIR
jgi:hypothetical protein